MPAPSLLSPSDSEKVVFLRAFSQKGPVVQWIERKFPKLLIGVRFTSGLLL